jgi:hypothetical protein
MNNISTRESIDAYSTSRDDNVTENIPAGAWRSGAVRARTDLSGQSAAAALLSDKWLKTTATPSGTVTRGRLRRSTASRSYRFGTMDRMAATCTPQPMGPHTSWLSAEAGAVIGAQSTLISTTPQPFLHRLRARWI